MVFTIKWLAALVLISAMPAIAQRYEPPPPPLTTAPCKPTKKDPCPDPAKAAPVPANPFPFPGEGTAETTQTDNPKGTAAPASAAPAGSFPFPGEAAPDMPGTEPGAAASSNSSSSSSGDDAPRNPDEPGLKDEGSTGSTRFARRKLAKVEDKGEREMKDVEVANYYLTTGNVQAAYLRAKDAIGIDAGDPAAHFALAQAAQRLTKMAEAEAEYQATLANDPTDKQTKEAKRALAELAGKAK